MPTASPPKMYEYFITKVRFFLTLRVETSKLKNYKSIGIEYFKDKKIRMTLLNQF